MIIIYHVSIYRYVHVDDDLRHKCIFQKIHLAYSLEKLYCKHACNLNNEVIYTNIVHVYA